MPLLVIISFSTTDYKLVRIDKFDSCHLKYSGLFRLRIKHITISTNMIMTNSDVKKMVIFIRMDYAMCVIPIVLYVLMDSPMLGV